MPRKPKVVEEEKPVEAPSKQAKVAKAKPPLKRTKAVVPKASPLEKWRAHLSAYRAKNPQMSLKEAMIAAKSSYKK